MTATEIFCPQATVIERCEMARIRGVPARDAGLWVRLVYYFTRRHLARLSGRPRTTIEPIMMFAHLPGLLLAYAGLEQATAKLHGLEQRHRALVELKTATLTQCEWCIDLGSQVARRWGLSDEALLALPSYCTSALFSDVDKLVLAGAGL